MGGTRSMYGVNPSNAELNPIRHLLALVGARHIVHVSRIRVKGEAYAVLMGKPEGTQRLGRVNHSLENDIKMDLEEIR